MVHQKISSTHAIVSVCWALFKTPSLCDKFDLDCILGDGDQLFKSTGKLRYLGTNDLIQTNEKKNVYLDCCSTIVSNYILGVIGGIDSIYITESLTNIRMTIYQVPVQKFF